MLADTQFRHRFGKSPRQRHGERTEFRNYFNPRWQTAYWGANYSRLQAVKAKYDPDGLFFTHNGVGSEGWSADGFTRS